jgi:hypothetical protein
MQRRADRPTNEGDEEHDEPTRSAVLGALPELERVGDEDGADHPGRRELGDDRAHSEVSCAA